MGATAGKQRGEVASVHEAMPADHRADCGESRDGTTVEYGWRAQERLYYV